MINNIIFIAFIVLIIFYKFVDPYKTEYYLPKCSFFLLTGYKCPGCGSQRALHYLFNFKIGQAVKENILLIILIPYILMGALLDMTKNKSKNLNKIQSVFYSGSAIWVVFSIILVFWITRNIFGF